MITLKEIDRHNFSDIISLSVSDEQKGFVASNLYSMAQAKAMPECRPFAIYNDDAPVGFIMYCMDYDDKEYWIYRLMIDKKHQGLGYGLSAMRCVLDKIMADSEHDRVYISFEPENSAARRLYEKLGFLPDGRVIGGEVVYCLRYGRSC